MHTLKNMTTLLVKGRTKKDVLMLKELAERLGLETAELSEQQKEDLGMARAIKQGRRSPVVSRTSVMRALERK